MKPPQKIALLFVLIAFAAMATLFIFALRQTPATATATVSATAVYQGKTARQWLREWPTNSTAVMQAIQAMGTNATPGIIETLSEPYTRWTQFQRKIYPWLPVPLRPLLPKSAIDLSYPAEIFLPSQTNLRPYLPELIQIAARKNNHGRFVILSATWQSFGAEDQQYVPTLVQFLADTNTLVRMAATWCLQKIGPPATNAIPALKTAMKDDNLDVRICAAWAIWNIDRETNLVSAALKRELNSPQPSTYRYKNLLPGFLREVDPRDPVILPSLIDQLKSSDENQRAGAAISLWAFGPEASTAVPALTNAIESGTPRLRSYAVRALKKIDPATALRYREIPDIFIPPPAKVPQPLSGQ